jgi:hypothetical protein
MTGTRTLRLWRVALLCAALVLYAVALSNQAYEATSPSSLSFHVLLRKAYSIGAFAVIGLLIVCSQFPGLKGFLAAALAVGTYSAAIELGQYLEGVREGLLSNALDVACGIAGGALGAFAARFID